jgi:hypothetical protein
MARSTGILLEMKPYSSRMERSINNTVDLKDQAGYGRK